MASVVKDDSDSETGPAGLLARTLSVLELLAQNAHGLQLFEIADRLRMPRSATHRVLTALVERNYVRQERVHGAYLLTAKVASLAFMFLAGSGVTDFAQPILDRLSRESGELVRLAIVDGEELTWVAKAQGSLHGLRYDPEMGQQARLSCSANGIALLACLDEETALALVARQGFGSRAEFGPKAPETPTALLKLVRAARKRGYSVTTQTFTPWMAAMAAPVRSHISGDIIGTVSIAGPYPRFTEPRMHEVAPYLLAAAQELGLALATSPSLMRRPASGSIFAEASQKKSAK